MLVLGLLRDRHYLPSDFGQDHNHQYDRPSTKMPQGFIVFSEALNGRRDRILHRMYVALHPFVRIRTSAFIIWSCIDSEAFFSAALLTQIVIDLAASYLPGIIGQVICPATNTTGQLSSKSVLQVKSSTMNEGGINQY
jgi:hypothetical protein